MDGYLEKVKGLEQLLLTVNDSLKSTHLQMWCDERKHTDLRHISGRLARVLASLITRGHRSARCS